MSFSCQWFSVSDEDLSRFMEAYPAVSIEIELRKMDCWLRANPERRKKKYPRFINNWLAKVHGRLLEAQVSANVKREQERADSAVGKWSGYK